jgi:thioredoxin reductase (NADPH)
MGRGGHAQVMANPDYPQTFDAEARRGQMFPTLDAGQAARMKPFGREQSFQAGEQIWDQGDEATPFHLVLEGQMEVVHPFGAEERVVTVYDPGQFSGEMSMLFGRRALLRGRAKTRLRTLRIEPARLHDLVQTDAELSEIVMRAFLLRRVGLLSQGWGDAVIVGSQNSAATLRLRAFLVRCGQPHSYVDVESDADVQQLLDRFRVDVGDLPILVCRGERVLKCPSNAEVADCLGLNPGVESAHVYDVIVCGAGPGGLAAAVYAASEGLDVMIVEGAVPGGQAGSSSKIENYLGFPTGISGQALMARGLVQGQKFGARIMVARGAVKVHCDETPLRVDIQGAESLRARALVIATGAQYRKLDIPDLARFEGAGVYYAATYVEAQRCGSDEAVVVGGGNSAGQAATFLSRTAKHVHMLIRGPDLAQTMSRYLIRRIQETPNITLHRRTRVVALAGGQQLEEVTWHDDANGAETRRPIRHVFSMAGAVPNTEWLQGCLAVDEKGFVLTGTDLTSEALRRERWPLTRPPMLFETSQPRVFSVGDVRANSVKRVASAVGEGSVCIQLVHRILAE